MTFCVDHENHLRLVNGKNVFLPKGKDKVNSPAHARRLEWELEWEGEEKEKRGREG